VSNDMEARVTEILSRLTPGGRPYVVFPRMESDEALWFAQAVEKGIVVFGACSSTCSRYRQWGIAGVDEFVTPHHGLRHLLSFPPDRPRLNREYVPHIAAYAKAIIAHGYDPARSAFSRYRRFASDAIARKAGSWYETDAEFYAKDGSIWLQVEAKRDSRQVKSIAAELDRAAGYLHALPTRIAKEIEYVIELRPSYLWLVGPGSIDPARDIFSVSVDGRTARFDRLSDLPPAT
jgi:hypothetical protein